MKYFILFFALIFQFSYSQTEKFSKYKIIEIGTLDDGSHYFKIKKGKEKAIIIETNDNLNIIKCNKIEKGKKYFLNLEKIETNFRGENDKYVLISEKGTQTVIWNKKDNYPLLIYKAKNIKDLCVVN